MKPGPLLVMDSGYPSVGGGGCENQCGTLGRWFVRQGYNTILIVPHDEDTPPIACQDVDGLPVRRILYRRIKLIGTLSLHAQVALAIWRRRHEYTAIYMHIANWLAVTVSVMGRLTGLPVIIKLTGQTELLGGVIDPAGGISAKAKRLGIRLATGYQAISREIHNGLLRVGIPLNKIHRIANAVDTARFEPTSDRHEMRERHCPGAEFIVLYVGRLEPVKNLGTLLKAWAAALGTDRQAWLVVAGHGPLRDNLQQQAERLGIADRLVFLGNVPDISTVTGWADFSVLPSHTEGLSNAMLECLAAGLPMIASNVGGNPDFVRDAESGWLFEPEDTDRLAHLLQQARVMPGEERQEMATRTTQLIRSEVSLDAVGSQLCRLLNCAN